MISTYIALERVSCVLPDGRILFEDLNEVFDSRPTGLVGRNGVGKSLLARVLAGRETPSSGRVVWQGKVHYLAQQASVDPSETVAHLANVDVALAALDRIEAGSFEEADFDAISERWNLREQLRDELVRHGLSHVHARTPAALLSGGEAVRVALIGAWLSGAQFLIMDEPTNHLDRCQRDTLLEQLRCWKGGLLVVSHDRELLDQMDRIVELSPEGLRSYGGGYAFYAECRENERANAVQAVERAKLDYRRGMRAWQERHEQQQRQLEKRNTDGRDANQARISLGGQKNRAQNTMGRLQQRGSAQLELLSQNLRDAASMLDHEAEVTMQAWTMPQSGRQIVARLDAVVLPYVEGASRFLALTITGRQRIGLLGPNGAGKSTLLDVLAGRQQPSTGNREVMVKVAYLDQRLAQLMPQRSPIDHLMLVNPVMAEGELRTRLAQMGLDAERATRPIVSLSGGEQLKTALACSLYGEPPAQLLLLDEPSNHLDLASLEALETVLRAYSGALVVASHDRRFMASLNLTHTLTATPSGWQLDTWR